MLDELDVFFGDATVHSARLYARSPRPADGGAWSLEGNVRGPFSSHGQTLPANSPLVDGGAGPTLLGEAVIPDPCFWTPENPTLYEIELRVLHEGREVAADSRTLGIRRLGVRGSDFVFDAKRWVLRGIDRRQVAHEPPDPIGDRQLHAWWDLAAAVVTTDPDDALCAAASREGVVILARLDTAGEMWRDELRRLAHWAAVGLVTLDGPGVEPEARVRNLAPNLCLVQSFRAGQPVAPAPWAHAVKVEVTSDLAGFASRVAGCSLPVIASRPLTTPLDLPEARAAVDALQRDLAPHGDYAGYVV
jgi:hypothetical protein